MEVQLGFEAMKIAHEVLPAENSNKQWKMVAVKEMLETNLMKFQACPHAQEALLNSKVMIAEVTSDKF